MARNKSHGEYIRQLKEQLEADGLMIPKDPSGHRISVAEDDPERTWRPWDRCPDKIMNLILEIVLRRGEARQSDITSEVAARTGLKIGTARANVSGALLAFREVGWVELARTEGRSQIWRVTS